MWGYSGHKFWSINESQWSHNRPFHHFFLSNSPFRRSNLSKMLEEPLKWPCFTAVTLSLVPHPKGHGEITSYLRDQSPVLMTGSCHSSCAQTTRGTCCSAQLKAWFVYSSSINLEDGFSVQAVFIIYLVPNIYYLFNAQNTTGLCGNMTEAESVPWKAFRLIKRLKEDEWGWMDKKGLEEIKYSIAPHYSPHRAILYSFLYVWNTCNGMAPLFGYKMGNWREKRTSGCMDSKENKQVERWEG